MPGLYLSKPVGFLLITVLKTCKHQSGYLQMFFKIAVLEILQIAQGNICVRVFFNRVTGLQVGNFLKKRLQNKCFPVKFVKFLRTSFLQNTSGDCLSYGVFPINTFLFIFRATVCIVGWWIYTKSVDENKSMQAPGCLQETLFK